MWFDNIKLLIFISHYKNGFNLQSLPGGITFRKLAINAVKIIKYTQLLQVYNTYLTYLLSYSGIYDPWYFLQKLTDTKQYLCHHSVYMWHVRVICLAKFWLWLMSFIYKKVCMSIHPMTSSHPCAMHSIVFLQPLHTFHLFSPGTFSQQWASSVSWWVLEGQQRKIGYFDLMIKFSIPLSLKRLNHCWKDSTETLFGSHSSYKTLTSVKND